MGQEKKTEKAKIYLCVGGTEIKLPEGLDITFTSSDEERGVNENSRHFSPSEFVELLRIYPELLKSFNSLCALSHQALG